MRATFEIDPHKFGLDINEVMNTLEKTDDLITVRMCNLYIDLARKISDNIVAGDTPETLRRSKDIEQELRDNLDRPYRHNVNPANRPSIIQEKYNKEW